ncbi:MAG TPA: glycoside hydrolase family 15 protein [Solirubrobacteraceae bacterium]|nr:glycoside hydrolase family 15 protein [Solirubrobacteraceae bacterium]
MPSSTSSDPTAAATTARTDGFLPIGGYAAVGDGRTLALVGTDGSIDWMCLPELDAPDGFHGLLDPERGGAFALAPAVPFRSERRYREGTNILETRFITDRGSVTVTDAVTLDSSLDAPWRELVRHVKAEDGEVPMRWSCAPTFGFATRQAQWESRDEVLLVRDGRLQIGLRAFDAGEPRIDGGVASGEFTLGDGESALLALLTCCDRALPVPARAAIERRLEDTATVWRSWSARVAYAGPWRDAVQRSLLALRLVADGRSGAIAAAGTSSLPEVLGGQKNYDYRYAWVRDLSFTVDALLRVGMEELAQQSIGWMLDAVGGTAPRVDPVYRLTGEVLRSQTELDLSGYRHSRPVLLGNQAGAQLQLGGAGDLIETVWQTVCHGAILSPATGELVADIADQLVHIWRHPDAGLWELGDQSQYMTSKLSCWVTFDRVLALADRGQVPARHPDRWMRARAEVREFIETELWSQSRRSYRFKAGSDELDCGVLLGARRGYFERGSQRLLSTIAAIESELGAGDGLFYRYSGMPEEENAFIACSFWMAEALAFCGEHERAHALVDQMVAHTNDVGLLSEQMNPATGEMMGNVPQALSHLGLINAACLVHELSK